MSLSKRYQGEVTFLLLLLAYFGFIFFGALNFPDEARLFPWVLGGPGILITLFLFYSCMQRSLKDQEEVVDTNDPVTFRAVLPFIFGILYFIAVALVGFLISTIVMCLGFPYYLGYRKKINLVIFTTILMITIIGIFGGLLSLNFPKGFLGLI